MDSCARAIYQKMGLKARSGRVQVMQIFKRLPQTITSRHLEEEKTRMDSIYRMIQNQPDLNFNRLVEIYSDDKQSRWIECLETTSEFENVAFSLAKVWHRSPFSLLKDSYLESDGSGGNSCLRKCQCQVNGTVTAQGDFDKGTGAVLERLKKHGSMLPIRRQWKNCWRKAVQNKPCLRLTDKHTPELCSRILPLLILKLSNGSWKDL